MTPAGRNAPLRIVVLGYIVRGPLGGLAWHHLQYVLGLRQLGHDVFFVEDNDDTPWSCYDPRSGEMSGDPAYGLSFAAAAFDRLGLGDGWAYFDGYVGDWHGPAGSSAVEFCAQADIVLNVSGVNPLRAWTSDVPHRILVDTDPVFTQLRIADDPVFRARADGHTRFFTFAENIRSDGAAVPALDREWLPTRQPVVLDAWPVAEAPPGGPYTTVMQWESYPAREHDGVRYGMKSDSFAVLEDLPARVDVPLELAVGSDSAPRNALLARGWRVVDPLRVASDPWSYQAYISRARGELTVAKHGYVVSRCGWFSERSAAFLASGRPVIAQETGFSDWLPTGQGLLAFSTTNEAAAALVAVEADYSRHADAARALAEEWFDARVVLDDLLARATS